ncbi:phosphoglycolate phosphatase [Pseudomonas sp. SJZ103]|uniref:HAD hydrolase-like protein n=1 Tax=unclassified Pseudomonas TaxID=196821 RepID=UPI00119E5B06|nr:MULTISPECIES: HAD hydrolase-like protein [unclassified Pseudomonas]TWC65036.1 phosphoglycolate phosphatase [Pseudomonas sp. SJZ103]TWC81789.1 phosphoglycolate phosphatase [Pseudomonas sp. SJZ094]
MSINDLKITHPVGTDAIIFDLDGTLVDSAGDMTAQLNTILIERNLEPVLVATTSLFLGDGMRSFARRAFCLRGVNDMEEAIDTFISRYEHTDHLMTKPYEGVIETLSALRNAGWKISVCTNKNELIAIDILKQTDLLRFMDVVCGGDSVSFKKPDPRHLSTVVALADYEKLSKIMIGDNWNDFEAARAYGIPFAFASWGYGSLPDDCKAVNLIKFSDILVVVGLPVH